MKRYGMMGGTFNPIHLAHLYIAYEAKEALNLDKVIFMVAGNPPHKKNTIIDAIHISINEITLIILFFISKLDKAIINTMID